MRVIGLISGGKDSIYNLIECMKNNHEIVCLGHLQRPAESGEMDCYMYQTVGSEMASAIAELSLSQGTLTKRRATKPEFACVRSAWRICRSGMQVAAQLLWCMTLLLRAGAT